MPTKIIHKNHFIARFSAISRLGSNSLAHYEMGNNTQSIAELKQLKLHLEWLIANLPV